MDGLRARPNTPSRAAFGRFDVHTQSWYAALPSAALRRGRATTRTLLGRQVAFYRAFRLGLELRGRPASRGLRRLTGSARGEIRASFTTVGGNLAWAVIEKPLRFYLLFSGRPSPHGGCDTRTFVFLPPRALARAGQAAALVYALLRDDRKVLDRLSFRPGFTDADQALASFFALVDALPVG